MSHHHPNPAMHADVDVVPYDVALDDSKLTLTWADKKAAFDGTSLRTACRCAQCRMARISTGASVEAPLHSLDVSVIAVTPMGYGLQLHFSDGHDRGIFPWAYLRELAPAR